jgi:succinyl-diaminopimelate desuccinylase
MDLLQRQLEALGFNCRRMKFGEIENLYAKRGTARPNLCFAGHTDVVPVGDDAAWTAGPFEAEIKDGVLYGRGAVDMKSAIAAFVAAVSNLPETARRDQLPDHRRRGGRGRGRHRPGRPGPGRRGRDHRPLHRRRADQRQPAGRHGQDRPARQHQRLDRRRRRAGPRRLSAPRRQPDPGADRHPEPPAEPGAGRRLYRLPALEPGSHHGRRRQHRHQRHPGHGRARVNIRFNPAHQGKDLAAWIEHRVPRGRRGLLGPGRGAVQDQRRGLPDGARPFTDVIVGAVGEATGRVPELSTTGGTSDARFIRSLCPVVEFGLVGSTMHAGRRARAGAGGRTWPTSTPP